MTILLLEVMVVVFVASYFPPCRAKHLAHTTWDYRALLYIEKWNIYKTSSSNKKNISYNIMCTSVYIQITFICEILKATA